MLSERHYDLPAPPTPEEYREMASDLVGAVQACDPEASALVEEYLGQRSTDGFGLDQAQQVIAAEHGYPDRQTFERAAQHRDTPRPISRLGSDLNFYHERAQTYLAELAAADEQVARRFRYHVARLADAPDTRSLAAAARLGDAHLVVAREGGCLTWREMVETVQRIQRRRTSGTLWCDMIDTPGELVTAVRAGDVESIRALLSGHPELVSLRDSGGGTLLETIVQPRGFGTADVVIDMAVVQAVIDAGADLNRAVNLAAGFNRVDILDVLLAAGADVTNTIEWGITPLEAALYHGSAEATQRLASIAIIPPGFWIAAGSDRVDLLEGFTDSNGGLRAEAYRWRPNLGDIGWPVGPPPVDDDQAVMAEAFVCACHVGAIAAIQWLLDHGVDVNARPWPGLTGLHFAVSAGSQAAVELLLTHGADLSIEDDQHHSTPVGWAEYHADTHPTSRQILRRLTEATR